MSASALEAASAKTRASKLKIVKKEVKKVVKVKRTSSPLAIPDEVEEASPEPEPEPEPEPKPRVARKKVLKVKKKVELTSLPQPEPEPEPQPEPTIKTVESYVDTMDALSQATMRIAADHLGSSFNLEKSNGYLSYMDA